MIQDAAAAAARATAPEGSPFVRTGWYVLALAGDVTRQPKSLRICDEPVVVYRTRSGQPVALQDRCPHRMVPLSMGRIVGDSIQCAYHGITFSCSGRCESIPGDARTGDRLPPQFDVPAFPVQEKYGFVWVWLGDRARARETALPPFTEFMDTAGWEAFTGYQHTQADVSLIIDNLLDLSHEAFLHPNTIGNAAVGESPARTQVLDASVEVERLMPDCPPPKMFKDVAGFSGNIDRYQKVVFVPPSACVIVVRATPAQGTSGAHLAWYVFHLLTPERPGSTHYFYALTRNFALGSENVTQMLRAGAARTLEEDHVMLEAQQRALAGLSLERRRLHTAFDGGPMAGRRLVARLLQEEREASPTRRS